MQNHPSGLVYKILDRQVLPDGMNFATVPLMPIDVADGYCHLSTAGQLAETLSLHFKGQDDLTILAIRANDIGSKLKWEPSRGGQLFPHAYGDIPRTAIEWVEVVSVAGDGSCELPDRAK